MRILSILALAAMTFASASCAKHEAPAPAPAYDGKTMHHHHGK